MEEENQTTKPATFDVEGLGPKAKHAVDEDGKAQRTGNVWTAAAHIITAVIGSGVLSLPWSIGQMGWIAGPLILILFAVCTYFTSRLLTDCYRTPDPVTGKRNYIYTDAVKANLSSRQYYLCGMVQYANLVGTSVGYTIASATSARAIQKTNCFHAHPDDACLASTTTYIGIYGVIQILLSQIPDFSEIWWLSYLAAVMSFTYATIILCLGISKTATKSSNDYGSVSGIGTYMQNERMQVWTILESLGNMAFAYSYSMILIEIQDTLRRPPAENKVMKRATLYGISTTTFFYLTVGIAGYLAFGKDVPGNILTGFQSPYWLVDIANACVIIHLVGAYQVFTQPVYQFVEMIVTRRYPKNNFLSKNYILKLPFLGSFNANLFRMIWRTAYVIIVTVVSMALPFFNDILGILGALGFWPLTVYFPITMYIAQHHVPKWSKLWIGMQAINMITLFVSLGALVGSVAGTIIDVQTVKFFKAT